MLQPEMANALEVSSDLVRIASVASIPRTTAVVVAISYPHSMKNFDVVAELLEIANFQLVNPRRPQFKPYEIMLASSLLELQKMTGLHLCRNEPEEEDDKEEETVLAIDLAAPPRITNEVRHGSSLIPSYLWQAHAITARLAAEAGARRLERRRLLGLLNSAHCPIETVMEWPIPHHSDNSLITPPLGSLPTLPTMSLSMVPLVLVSLPQLINPWHGLRGDERGEEGYRDQREEEDLLACWR